MPQLTLQALVSPLVETFDPSAPEATLAALQAQADRISTPGYGVEDLALILVRAVVNASPQGAAALLQSLDVAGAAGPRSWNLAADLHDRLGEKQAARELSERVLATPGCAAGERLLAATLLVRFGDAGAISIAAEAYEALGTPLAAAGKLLFVALRSAAWPLVDQLTADLRAAYARGNYREPGEAAHGNLLWCGDHRSNVGVAACAARRLPPPAAARPTPVDASDRPLRLGYLSSDFRQHPSARLFLGLLRHHDPERVEVTLYCSGWDDGSELRQALGAQVACVRSVGRLGAADAAAQIRADGIDVLVEMNGYTRGQRLDILRQQPAPVLVHYLGFPGSLGGGVVDYILGDRVSLPPGLEPDLPEAPIRLPHTHFINDHASYPRPPPPPRASFGLPSDVLVLGVFNGISKIRSEVWSLWMELLREVPGSVLWLLDPGSAARANLLEATRAAAVDPRRIVIAPRLPNADHLRRLQHCDLMLDPWPCGGHTSTCDALFAGVPVLTLRGGSIAGRISASILEAAGRGDLVHDGADGYREAALDLLRHPQRLRALKARIRSGALASPAFDAAARTRELEAAFRAAHERAVAGLPPGPISVPAGAAAR